MRRLPKPPGAAEKERDELLKLLRGIVHLNPTFELRDPRYQGLAILLDSARTALAQADARRKGR